MSINFRKSARSSRIGAREGGSSADPGNPRGPPTVYACDVVSYSRSPPRCRRRAPVRWPTEPQADGPAAGVQFIPRTEKICGQYGCFECYDIFCERCETKDRRIIELEMRAADMARHVQTLYSKLQRTPQGGASGGSPGAASPSAGTALAGQPFATTRSPVLEDPHRGAYIAQTDYYAVNATPDKRY